MNKRLAGTVACAAVLGLALTAMAQAGRSVSSGVFSKVQADHGNDLFQKQCARCHGNSMEGLDVAPPLTGPKFMGNYVNQPVAALASRIRTSMPLDMPGSLGLQDSADLTTAILAANGYPAGQMDMPSSVSAMQTITLDPPK